MTTGHTVGVVQDTLGFGVSSSGAFHCRKVEIQGLNIAIFTRYWQNDLIGVQTAPQRLILVNELREQILERREEVSNAPVSGGLGQDDRRWRRGFPPRKCK